MTQAVRDPLCRRHRFPAEVIAHAAWLYIRLPLNLRMVEDMRAARGISVSHQTVRLRADKFGRRFANEIRQRSVGKLGDKWYLDDVVISIGGQLRSYGTAKRDIMPGVAHRSHKGLNNRAENSPKPARRR
jgi:putative transposase